MPDTIQTIIRERVTALLAARPEVTPADFGRRIGRGYAWVNAFLNGTRFANDVHLLRDIARFFGVTVGYLLNETEKDRDPGATILLTTYEALDDRGRALLLDLATSLRKAMPPGGGAEGSGGEGGRGLGRPRNDEPQKRKR